MRLNKAFLTISAAAIVSAGIFGLTQAASAHVVCNRTGDCWSTHANVQYPSDLGIRTYSDRYANDSYRQQRWGNNSNRTWRGGDHDRDRGAYRGGLWVGF